MSAEDRLIPKQIKAWCKAKMDSLLHRTGRAYYGYLNDEEIVNLMIKAYKRGYQDALGG